MVRKLHPDNSLRKQTESPQQREARVLAECLDRVNAGETVDVDKIRAEHPDLEPRLGEALKGLLVDLPSTEEHKPLLEKIGDYQLLREAGRGGMGIVYEAWQKSMERRVAVKVLPANLLGDRRAVARFEREAKVASRLDHPGICTVFEAGTKKGIPYIAMRYIEGETLSRKISRAKTTDSTCVPLSTDNYPGDGNSSQVGTSGSTQARPWGQTTQATRGDLIAILQLVERVARALYVAHEAGFVHRDIKPSNIMITGEGDPVLLDFGLARGEDDDVTDVTRTGELLGTLDYMAPERVISSKKSKKPLDHRADIYSLGVTLYESLTLRRPFYAAGTDDLFRKIRYSDPPNPRHINPQVSRDLKIVLEAALEKDPNRRYQTALDFANDLRRIQNYEPIKARPTSRVLRVRRWTQRNPVGTTLILMLSLFVATFLGLFLWAKQGWNEIDDQFTIFVENLDSVPSEVRAKFANRTIPAAIAQRAVRLTFAVYTSDKPLDMYKMFDPVLTYVERRSWARPESAVLIDLRIFRSYEQARKALVNGRVDFVRFGPASYILAKNEKPQISLLAIEEKKGKRVFQAIIFARKGSPIKKIADIEGKKFAFGNEYSTIGHWLTKAFLAERGIHEGDLPGSDHLGNHPAVAEAVRDGKFDVGAVKENTFRKYEEEGLVEIASFEVVTKPWVARAGLDARVLEFIKESLFTLKEGDGALSPLKLSGFGEVEDAAYNGVRDGMDGASKFFELALEQRETAEPGVPASGEK